MKIYLDIETLPTRDEAFIADIANGIVAPGNISKPESIAAWNAEKKPAAVKEAVKKTSFDGLYGSVACICWAYDDKVVEHTDPKHSERQLLMDFFGEIELVAQHKGEVQFIGHNIAGFDLPFLKHRAIINGIKPPHALARAMAAKSWDSIIADTMLMWSSDRERRVSMDKLCKAFGISGKGDFDGSMVADTWPVDPQKVIDYCVDDVKRTREIYKRLTFAPEALKEAA